MRLLFSFWRLGINLNIWAWDYSWAVRNYFYLRLWFSRYEAYINFYQARRGGFMYHANLPFISIMNDVVQRAVSRGTDATFRVEPVVTGKIFGIKLKSSK